MNRYLAIWVILLVVLASVKGSADSDIIKIYGDYTNPAIPISELELGLTPLTESELAALVDSFQKQLHNMAEEVSNAELSVSRTSGDERAEWLSKANTLRESRTALIDRYDLALNEWKQKGADEDALKKHKLYVRAVSGTNVDISDTKALWTTVSGWVKSKDGGVRWAKNIGKFLLIVIVSLLIAVLIGRLVNRILGAAKYATSLMQDFISKMVTRILFAVGVIMGLSTLEVDIGPLLAVIGAAGFVVAFALQDTLSSFASGLMILMYRPFDVDDVVEVGGVFGTVQSLNLVSVTIRTFDNKIVVVPNNNVWGNVITNATGSHQRRVDMTFGISYDSDITKAQTILEEIVRDHELVLDDPEPVIKLHELADSSVNFVCRPWVKTADYWTVHWDVTKAVKERFDAANIIIPFPQRDVHIYNEGT